jgi:putative transcriptional regulator
MRSDRNDNRNEMGYLAGQLLVAMPNMPDPRFERTVIYMCAHSAEGAMGLVVNRLFDAMSFGDLLDQLGIEHPKMGNEIRVHSGGPVESGRGFVLHSADFQREGTMQVDDRLALTASIDILHAIANHAGPRRSLLALGYSGWGPGQLETEIQANGWLHVPADENLVFDADIDGKWQRSIAKIGVDFGKLSGEAGHA